MTSFNQNATSTREALINEALDQFASHGIAETSIRSICNKLGQSTASIGYHFGSKEGLAAEVIEECLARLSKAFAWFEKGENFEHTCQRFSEHMVAHSKEMFVLYRFTFSQDLSFFKSFRQKIDDLRQSYFQYFKKEGERRGLKLNNVDYKIRSDTYLQALMQEVLNRTLEEEYALAIEVWNKALLTALLGEPSLQT